MSLFDDPESEKISPPDDAKTTTSEFTWPHPTPSTSRPPTPTPNHVSAIPWYDKTYMILEKKTGKAITLSPSGLHLKDPICGPNESNSWLCVSKDNYTGFLHSHARVYLGHDGKEIESFVHANAGKMLEYESFFARQHPEGGYQLLSPYGSKMLWIVVGASWDRVMRARHGDTLWVFEEV